MCLQKRTPNYVLYALQKILGTSISFVLFMGISGCYSNSSRLENRTGSMTDVLISSDGDILGVFGNPKTPAISKLKERIRYVYALHKNIKFLCSPTDGEVLVATEGYNGCWDTGTSGNSPWTIVWRDWRSTECPIVLARNAGNYISNAFIETTVPNTNGWPIRYVVDLSDPNNEYLVPEEFIEYNLLSDGRWVALTESEILSGKLVEGGFLIERRMSMVSELSPFTSITWLSNSKYVLIHSPQPTILHNTLQIRKDTVLLDWIEWRLIDQPDEMYLAPCGMFKWNEQPVFLAKSKGMNRYWKYALINYEGNLAWSEWRSALPWLYDPQYISPDGKLIISRQNSRLLLYPGASPKLRISTLDPENRRRDVLKLPWTSVAGWLTISSDE